MMQRNITAILSLALCMYLKCDNENGSNTCNVSVLYAGCNCVVYCYEKGTYT